MIAAVFVLHLVPRPGYGFHRDELLYLAMGDHLELFGMQFPPMIAVLAQFARLLPLPLQAAVHLLPALAVAGIMALAVATARRLGGGAGAELITALGVAAAPLFERAGVLFQPVVFEQLWWSAAALALAALLAGGDRRWWLVLGAAMGLGGMTKFSALLFGLGAAAMVLLSPLRRELRTRWPWLALLTAVLLALPSITGQIRHGWPFFAQMRALQAGQLERVTAAAFLGGQVFMAGAASVLLIAGLTGLLLSHRLRPWRGLATYALVPCVILLVMRGKEYYLGPVHPPLIAAGAVLTAEWVASRPALRAMLVTFLLLGGLLLLPLGIPLLPPPQMAVYASRLGITRAVTTNGGGLLPLPQDFADMTGWREQVAAVAEVYRSLPEAERARTLIVGGNYGRAGALAAYRRDFGLPYPASRHGDFFAWGAAPADPATVIIVGGTVEELKELFAEVQEAGRSLNRWAVPEEQDVRIHICRRPHEPFERLWRRLGPVWG